jgi:hypothetical protein
MPFQQPTPSNESGFRAHHEEPCGTQASVPSKLRHTSPDGQMAELGHGSWLQRKPAGQEGS